MSEKNFNEERPVTGSKKSENKTVTRAEKWFTFSQRRYHQFKLLGPAESRDSINQL
jgi:hypothetical protein